MKKAIITGGSSGLGKDVVSLLDCPVVNISRRESLAGVNIECDLSDADSVKKILPKLTEHQDCDLLILNAGLANPSLVGNLDFDTVEKDVAVNLTSAIQICNAMIDVVKENKGDIVIVGSTSSFRVSAKNSVYAAAKHGIRAFAKGLHTELKKEDVRVIGFFPGGFASEFHPKAGTGLDQSKLMPSLELAKLIIHFLKLPRSMQVSEVIVDRRFQN